ncbi:MAG: hypothetical protein IJF54_03495 [Clostridia bacterium]|nr:hypothetical protein [Clostridia bacterium]
MKKIRISALILAMLLVLSTFTACTNEPTADGGESTTANQTVIVEAGGTTGVSVVTPQNTTKKDQGANTTKPNGTTAAGKPNATTTAAGKPDVDSDEPTQGGWNPDTPEFQTYSVTDFKNIYFDSEIPSNLIPTSAWDAMGVDNNGIVYFGWTCTRRNDRKEDFAVFSYNPSTAKVKYLGSFMTASEEAGNLKPGEQIPKGHTKFIYHDGKMYMGSQGFHDFKEGIGTLSNYRGGHIYAYDIAKGKLEDLSASLPDGIAVKNEGILALNFMPERNLLVGLTHPHSNLVFYNIKTGKIERQVQGIPWSYGNPLSREIVISGDKIYMYRGVEEPRNSAKEFNVYVYDYAKDTLTKTDDTCYGGFWNGQVTTLDGKTTFISTCCGELYKLDHLSGRVSHVTSMVPLDSWYGNSKINTVYSLTLSSDGKKIYYLPSMYKNSGVVEYDIESDISYTIYNLPMGVYTGNGVMDKNGYLYFASFSTTTQNWVGDCKIIAFKIEKK